MQSIGEKWVITKLLLWRNWGESHHNNRWTSLKWLPANVLIFFFKTRWVVSVAVYDTHTDLSPSPCNSFETGTLHPGVTETSSWRHGPCAEQCPVQSSALRRAVPCAEQFPLALPSTSCRVSEYGVPPYAQRAFVITMYNFFKLNCLHKAPVALLAT